jgi:transposase-like protein
METETECLHKTLESLAEEYGIKIYKCKDCGIKFNVYPQDDDDGFAIETQ